MNIDHVVAQYREQHKTQNQFTEQIHGLLEILLGLNQIKFEIESRTKDENSFRGKISRNPKKYSDPLREITDLSGVRIIVQRLSEIPKVTKIIKGAFSVDPKNSRDKKDDLDADRFGYRSVHLIVGMHKSRNHLEEWQPFRSMKAEIQVRTFLQHVWAVNSHTLDYKVKADIPKQLHRRLARLAALFESSDDELNSLAKAYQAQIKVYEERLKSGDAKIDVNIDSLRVFIETNDQATHWIELASELTGRPINSEGNLSAAVQVARFCKLKTLGDVQRIIQDAHGWGEKFISNYFAQLADLYDTHITSTNPSKNGIISGLIIASNAEKLSDEILEGEFGFPSSPILSAALKARVPS